MRTTLVVAALAVLVSAAPARAQDPALAVPEAELARALTCPKPLAGATRAPVLLIPGTNLEPRANFDWNSMPALDAAGIPWCSVTLPRYGMGDVQTSAEYVVFALRRMRADSGRRVSIVGFSQGGMIGRWALRWWPSTRPMVEDLVGLAPSNHGTQSARNLCRTSCPASYWQQRDDAKFIAALNSGPETFAGIDYTVAFTRYDEVVTPNADAATGSSALRTGDGRRSNTLIQDVCPANTNEHLNLGSFDNVGWALALDALTHDGPADASRLDKAAVCAQPFMPGVNPATFAADYARYTATVGEGARQAEYVPAEPPLRCYVTGTCGAAGTTTARRQGTTGGPRVTKSCMSRRRFVIRLDRRLRRATVTVAGRRVGTRRRGGRLVATVDLRKRRAETVLVRVRGTTKSGRRLSSSRRYRTCVRR